MIDIDKSSFRALLILKVNVKLYTACEWCSMLMESIDKKPLYNKIFAMLFF